VKRIFAVSMGIGLLIVGSVLGQATSEKENADTAVTLWSAATLPPPIQQIVRNYAGQCHQLGGSLSVGGETPAIMTADLDADGVQDYVLDPQTLRCSAAATAFCGNGGCDIKIAVSSDQYAHPVSVLGGQPTLLMSADGPVVDIWVERSHCNIPDAPMACWARYSWKDGKALTAYRAKPVPK